MRHVSTAVLILFALCGTALAQVDDPATPSKDESIVTSGFPAATVTMSTALADAIIAAAGQIEPYNTAGLPSSTGMVLENCIGMSNAIDYCQQMYLLLWKLDYLPVKAANYKLQRVAQAGHTAKEWANCNDGVWTNAVQSAIGNAGHVNAVQDATIFMTEYAPQTYGVMSWAQLDAIAACHIHWFPKTRKLTFSTIQWTGQSRSLDYAPVWSVASDDALLAQYQGVHSYVVDGRSVTIPITYLQVYADGNVANPRTSSASFPAGLTWLTEDSVTDGIHPSTVGKDKMARNILERERSPFWWYRWKDISRPVTGPPPPPPPTPVTVPLSNATVTKDGTSCTVQGTEPNGVIYSAGVPAIWCAGL